MCGTYCLLVLHYTCELLRRLLRAPRLLGVSVLDPCARLTLGKYE